MAEGFGQVRERRDGRIYSQTSVRRTWADACREAGVEASLYEAVAGLVLLTRDATRYRTYFPGLEIIAP